MAYENIMKSSKGNFVLTRVEGIGRNDIPYIQLQVRSVNDGEKYVVRIDLESRWVNFDRDDPEDKTPIRTTYTDRVTIAHGFRSTTETLEETAEYIEVMKEALDFAYKVKEYIIDTPEWRR